MKYFNEENILKKLISEYKEMSQKGTVCFFEGTAFLDIMLYFENEGNIEEAIEVCDLATTQHMSSVEFYFHKGRLLLEIDKLEIALENIEKALSLSPNNHEANFLYIEILIELNDFPTASSHLEKIDKGLSKNKKAHLHFLQSRIHERKGDFPNMFFSLREALLANSDNPIMLNKIWLAAEISGLYEESAAFHLQLIEENPYSYLAWYNLGQAYFCLEKYEESAEAFEYVFIINKQFDIAYRDGAEALIMANKYDKALEVYEELLEICEPDGDVYAKIGLCQEHLGERDVAKVYYLKSLQENPSNSMALFRMGECYMIEEQWSNAIKYYNKAIDADSNREDYVIAIAQAYSKNKNTKKAKIFFEKATEMAPELTKHWTEYASFLMKIGNNEEAFFILDEAENYTLDTEVQYCKVACLFAMKKREEALKTLSQALQKNPSLLESLFALIPELEQDSEVKALIKIFCS